MDQAKIIKAKEYYEKRVAGESRESAALAVYGRKTYKGIEKSPEYLAVVSAANQIQKNELKQEVEEIKRKQIKSYSKLIDKGEELMDEATTIEEKVIAQQNQRANLTSGIIENAIAWDSEDRNQNDLGDVLEGVIV